MKHSTTIILYIHSTPFLGHSLYDLGQEAGSEAQYDHILSFVQEQKSALCLHIAHIDSWD